MRNIFISPLGSGTKSGSDANNAMALSSINAAVKAAGAGGQVSILADQGAYEIKNYLSISAGGTAGAPVTIRGVSSTGAPMDAVFNGSRAASFVDGGNDGNTFFRFNAGADHLVISNIDIHNAKTAFLVNADIADLTIQNVDATNVYRFFEDYAATGTQTATIDGLTIRNVNVTGFEKGVIRLQYDTNNVLIDNVHGDAAGQVDDFFAIGVHLDGTVHDVVIQNSSMANVQNFETKYWNGDAFATERGVHDVVIRDTIATGSTDAGFDLKSTGTTLIRTFSGDNAKNYKLWGDIALVDVIGADPHVRGGNAGQNQVYVIAGAKVTMDGGTFRDAGGKTVVFSVEGALDIIDAPIVSMAQGGRFVVGTMTADLAGILPTKTALAGAFSSGSAVPFVPEKTVAIVPAVVAAAPIADAALPIAAEPAIVRAVTALGTVPFKASAGQDMLTIDMAKALGAQTVSGFAANDVIASNALLPDGNRDGIVMFGEDGKLAWGGSSLNMGSEVQSLRYLGTTENGHLYANSKTKLKAWTEGTTADNAFSGDAAGKVSETFFFDNALHIGVGRDKIANFGGGDRIVLTEMLDTDAGGTVRAVNGSFDVTTGIRGDAVSIANVDTLHFAGATTTNGVVYFSYAAGPAPAVPDARTISVLGDAPVAATAGQDVLKIDMAGKVGNQSFAGFATNDLIVTNAALPDGNRDGIVTFGEDGRLGWSNGSLDLGKQTEALRYLGVTEDGHAYASARTKLKGWIEGTTADDALRGDAKGVVKDVFFFDNALHLGVGDDRVAGMKGDDRIVLTEALDADAAGVVRAVDGAFDLTRGVAGDSVTVAGVDALHFAGTTVANGTIYYHYAALDEVLI